LPPRDPAAGPGEYHVIPRTERGDRTQEAARGAPPPRKPGGGDSGCSRFGRKNSGTPGDDHQAGRASCGGAQEMSTGRAGGGEERRPRTLAPIAARVLGARGEHRDPGAAGAQPRSPRAASDRCDHPPDAAFQTIGAGTAGRAGGARARDVDLVKAGLGQGLQRKWTSDAADPVAAAVDDGRLVPARMEQDATTASARAGPAGRQPAKHHPGPVSKSTETPRYRSRTRTRRRGRRAAPRCAAAKRCSRGGDLDVAGQ